MGWQYLSFGEERSECVVVWTNVGKCNGWNSSSDEQSFSLTLRLLMSYIYGAPSKARNANVVYIWTYVWQR